MDALTSQDAFEQWHDWRWQMRNRIDTLDGLRRWITPTDTEKTGIAACGRTMRWSITPYYASLMDPENTDCPIRMMAVPRNAEFVHGNEGHQDPVGDRTYLKTRRIIHKYPDRVVFLVSDSCPVYCRYCTRKYHTIARDSTYFKTDAPMDLEADFAYIRDNPEINDVLLTGGDPLSLSTGRLDAILGTLKQISSVGLVRIGTRYPVLLPARFDDELMTVLAKHAPLYLSTHFNHPAEITPEAVTVLRKLQAAGVALLNQSVLLKGVNDDAEVLKTLCRRLVSVGVTPYYLYHCDNVAGLTHFITTIERGRALMAQLSGHVTGFATPRYIIVTTIGKIPIDGDHVTMTEDGIIVRNYKGETLRVTCSALVHERSV